MLSSSKRFVLWLGAMAALCFTTPLDAQVTTGTFRGRITNNDGQPVVNAQVIARNTATGVVRGTLTDASGRYLLALVPPGGPYTVRVESIGFAPEERPNLQLSAGDVQTIDIQLAVQAVQLQGIEASVAAQRVDVAQTGVVQRVGQEQIQNLPVNGRDFVDFLNLSALVSPQPETGTGGQFSIGGARTSGTNIQVDGADANNVFFGENRGSSRSPFTFSLESIREFQLITNGWDVEYGNYQGGVMNAVTKSGTNDFDGSAFYFNRGEAFTANDFNLVDPTDFKVHQFGASLSGPIKRDRLHFFASVDGQQRNQPTFAATASSANVSEPQRQAYLTALEAYGVTDPERYYGIFQQTQDNLVLFGRLDWALSDAHRLTVRQNFSNFKQENDRIASNEAVTGGGPFKDKVYSTVAELNSIFSQNVFNTFRLQFSYEDRPRPPFEDGGSLPEIRVNNVEGTNRISFGGDGTIFRNRLEESKFQLINNLTWRAGAHTIKLGTNNILSNTTNQFWLAGNGLYTFNSLALFQARTPSRYQRTLRACPVALTANQAGELVLCPEPDVPIAEFAALEWSGYLQDALQLSERLTVTAGVRLSGVEFQDEPDAVPAVEAAFTTPGTTEPIETGIIPSFFGVSPRLSFAYDLSADLPASIRGGVGLLTGRVPTVVAGNVFQTERPLLSVDCSGTQIPTLNFAELFASPTGLNNPVSCRSGAAPTGRPDYAIFDEDFAMPKTLKANLGYERLLPTNTRFALDFIFSESWDMYTIRDLNLRDPVFTLAFEEGRPVYVPAATYNPNGFGGTGRLRNAAFNRVFFNTSDGEARAFNVNVTLEQRFSDRLNASVNYGFNRAYDNSSYSCCTTGEGWGTETTWGDPNFLGDPGEDEEGAWGVSRFERRHVIVGSAILHAPLGINVNGIWRSQSGTPWTPVVQGDLNGDDQQFNDRAFVSREHLFATPADAERFEQILEDFDCVSDQLGRVVARNSCRNPWWHTMDLRLSKEFRTFRGQRLELMADFFNVVDGVGQLFCDSDEDENDDGRFDNAGEGSCGWGDYRAVFTDATNLLTPCTTAACAGLGGYDAATGKVRYRVVYNRDLGTGFGAARPSGFDPFQFQAQFGIRYRF